MSVVLFTTITGDTLYTVPSPGGYGFIFSRSSNPSGDSLPAAVLLRDGRVYLLRPASAYGVTTAVYVCETPITSKFGQAEASFCNAVWTAWAEHFGASGSSPEELSVLAELVGWVLV